MRLRGAALLVLICLSLAGPADRAGAETAYFLGATAPEDPIARRQLDRFPCHSCHGRDGRGGTEGDAPAINWASLAVAGRDRPAYDAETFFRAVSEGIAASGRELSRLMPRYRLSRAEAAALQAELAALEERERRGVLPRRVVLGVPQDLAEELGPGLLAAIRRGLSASLAGEAAYGRTVELRRVGPAAPDPAEDVLAVIAPPADQVDALTARGIPVIAPIGQLAGDEDRTIVRAITPSRRHVLQAIARQLLATGSQGHAIFADRPEEARELADLIRLSGGVAGRDAARSVPDAILLGQATLPPGITAERLWVEWPSLAVRPPPSGPEIIVVLDAPGLVLGAVERNIHPALLLAERAGQLAGEALKLAGRDLTRTRFMAAFDAMGRIADLDYGREPLTGTSNVVFHRLKGRAWGDQVAGATP